MIKRETAHLVSGTTAAPGPNGRLFKAAEPFQLVVISSSPSHALEVAEQELQRQYASRRDHTGADETRRGRKADGDDSVTMPIADVVRRLNRWSAGVYAFHRRPDALALEVENGAGPRWPFVVSVKSAQGPSLAVMLEAVSAGRPWPWWQTLEVSFGMRPWLIWPCEHRWMLSLSSLGMLDMPPRLTILPLPIGAGWPRFTLLLDRFLESVPVGKVAAAIADGWGT